MSHQGEKVGVEQPSMQTLYLDAKQDMEQKSVFSFNSFNLYIGLGCVKPTYQNRYSF